MNWGMRRLPPPEPYEDAKLLGILLAGAFAQTREDCSAHARLALELRPSGVHRLVSLPEDPEQ
jgi:hypothetical protein